MKTGIKQVTAATALALVLVGCSPSNDNGADVETVNLSLDYYANQTHPFAQHGIEKFVEEVQEKSGGAIQFTVYPAGQLGAANDALSRLSSGISDLTMIFPGYFPEELPLTQSIFLPLGIDPAVASYAQWRLLNEPGPVHDEWIQAKALPLIVSSTEATELQSVDSPVGSPDDIRGMKVRTSTDPQVSLVEALNMSSVQVTTAELYEALQRGTADATLYLFGSWPSLNLQELVRHSTLNLNFTVGNQVLAMNPDVFASLGDEHQAIVLEAARNASISSFDAIISEGTSVREAFVADSANTAYEWSDEDLAQVREASNGVVASWVERGEAAGLPASEAMNALRKFLQEAPSGNPATELPSYDASQLLATN